MKEFSIELAAERIVDHRTKEYFFEVLSSFVNGSYRSAVVMLWSVVVADLVYKLQTLRDIYQDQTAISILESIEKKQQLNPSSPDWEPFLLDEINTRTNLLEVADYQHLSNLQKLRHLSAHPVLSSANLLFSPNKETTRSAIRNAMEAVLLKPPIFSKKIVTEFVADIAGKRELLPDHGSLKQYVEAKYFKNLHASVEKELIKALWKFCFRISNQDTDLNREINLRALKILFARNPIEFRQFVLLNTEYFSEIAANGAPLESLINFISDHPSLFSALSDAAKVPLANFAQTNINLYAAASFTSDDFASHIDKVAQLPYEQLRDLNDQNWKILVARGEENGIAQKVLGIGIRIYCGSLAFDTADSHFARFIRPHIDSFDQERVIQILAGIEKNNQTYWRGRSKIDHPLIADRAEKIGGIDVSLFPNFHSSLPKAT